MTTEPSSYAILVRGRLGERFAGAFEGMAVEPGDGTTLLTGELRDAAHLYGVLNRLRDFGLEIVRLEEVRP